MAVWDRWLRGGDSLVLTPTEWKALMDEAFSPLLERELGLSYLGNYFWAGPWEAPRRRMVRVFLINQSSGTLQWGWAFDFAPHLSGKRLAWHRTDRSARQDVWEVSPDFVKSTGPARDRVTFSAWGRDRRAILREHRRAILALLPQSRRYYAGTARPEALLRSMETALEDPYVRFTQGTQLTISAAFLAAALGRTEHGRELLAHLNVSEQYQETRRLLTEQLDRQPRLWPEKGETGDDPDHR